MTNEELLSLWYSNHPHQEDMVRFLEEGRPFDEKDILARARGWVGL